MSIDLCDLKVGDSIFGVNGYKKITDYDEDATYKIELENGNTYTLSGRFASDQDHPSIFHSKDEFLEYFSQVEEEKDLSKELMSRNEMLGYVSYNLKGMLIAKKNRDGYDLASNFSFISSTEDYTFKIVNQNGKTIQETRQFTRDLLE